ncbi:hypothetical protein SDC9_160437 [bioreactor metagenome]|uniref:Uncharacterized protein n=1 Tax=bioreactor metagenome TaxID=1076179 RepID=A0A645FFL2_9ZZZZ
MVFIIDRQARDFDAEQVLNLIFRDHRGEADAGNARQLHPFGQYQTAGFHLVIEVEMIENIERFAGIDHRHGDETVAAQKQRTDLFLLVRQRQLFVNRHHHYTAFASAGTAPAIGASTGAGAGFTLLTGSSAGFSASPLRLAASRATPSRMPSIIASGRGGQPGT